MTDVSPLLQKSVADIARPPQGSQQKFQFPRSMYVISFERRNWSVTNERVQVVVLARSTFRTSLTRLHPSCKAFEYLDLLLFVGGKRGRTSEKLLLLLLRNGRKRRAHSHTSRPRPFAPDSRLLVVLSSYLGRPRDTHCSYRGQCGGWSR